MRRAALGCLYALAAVTLGCAVGPDYSPPEPVMPDMWHEDLTRGLATGDANLATWWTLLEDPLLNGLIERAHTGSYDVEIALDRIQEARAELGIATGEFSPDVDVIGDVQRDRVSENLLTSLAPPRSRTDTFYGLGGDATWEIDVWGRIRRSVESADARLRATVENYRDVLVSLYADMATTYVELRALQARLRYALGNIDTQRGTLQLTISRRDAGIGSELDVAQASLNLARTESVVPLLRSRLAQSIHRLGVLLGEHPSALYPELESSAPIPAPPEDILVGVPAELLRQRPDVRRAERDLAAQTALVGVATADLYPRFSLTGFFAWESFSASDTYESASRSYSFGPSMRWNLFDGGRVRSVIQVQDARAQEALAVYEQTVLDGLEDVENSMVAYVEESDRRDALARSVDAARKSVELVTTLYRVGLTDFQNVLDMERSLFDQEDLLAQSQGRVTQNLISIYRAMGGGWAPSAPAP